MNELPHQMALDFYQKSVEKHPNDARICNSLGMLYWRDGEVKKAIENLVKALRIKPDFSEAFLNLKDVLINLNESKKAEKLNSSYLSLHSVN